MVHILAKLNHVRASCANTWVLRACLAVLMGASLVGAGALFAAHESTGLKVSDSDNVGLESVIAVGPATYGVAWAGNDVSRGVYLAEGSDRHWTQSTVVLPTVGRAWNPSLVYSEGEWIVAWTQGSRRFPSNTVRSIQWRRGDSDGPQVLVPDVYGDVAPHLVSAPTGLHMVYAAATDSARALNAELYYIHHPPSASGWSSPQKVADLGGASSPIDGIWRPRLATDTAGETLHVVWERTSDVSGLQYSIWHLTGTVQLSTTNVDWGTPTQLSPASQRYAMRPDVAVDEDGEAHVVWTEVIPTPQGSILPAEAQHVNHWRSTAAVIQRVNAAPIKVNSTQPTWTSSAVTVGTARLCVAWHGYAPDDAFSKEEVALRCSRDGGLSWQSTANLSQSEDQLSLFPAIVMDLEGIVHASWVEEALSGVEFRPVGIYYALHDMRSAVFLPLVVR